MGWLRVNFPRVKDTMLFLYLGTETVLFEEMDGSRSLSARFGPHLAVGWDGEFSGPDLQLWLNLGLISVGVGIETNPYIEKIIERGT
ncbi:hypothetical protein LCGC14_2046400 [marine sediment metagenome]|uniref:Uncharacterized protein n=1 Tax=marine sediment metagenome TaxID=412755 RepID=A0A0F9EQJ1_9ZZZZ